MKEGLNIEQTQQTVQRLSPRQVQFVRLLEMTGPEIEEEVRRQLDDNPALETMDVNDKQDDTITEEGTEIIEDPINNDPDDDPADFSRSTSGNDTESFVVRQIAEDTPDLYGYLINQLGEYEMSELTRQIATYIIGNIDENGYLTRTLADMADDIEIATSIPISHEQMKEAFDMVRTLDPAGVCAVDLRDCLLLQLKRIKPVTLAVREARDILTHYFDLLSKKHLDRLQAHVGITDKAEMQAALDLIKSLNPKPGSSIAPTQTSMRISQISPDVQVDCGEDGRINISLLSNLPNLQISKSFELDSLAERKGSNTASNMHKQAQAFIKLKRDDAEAFISALQQRSATLLAVTEAIVRLQPEFFASGDSSRLRPMILKDVAAMTGLDISVISRATAGKYLATNSGSYPLKMFFNEAPKDNSDTSSHQIMHALQEIINNENKRHPLSDEAIREIMVDKGYDVARRTVTKYRERLGIPVGRLRKSI